MTDEVSVGREREVVKEKAQHRTVRQSPQGSLKGFIKSTCHATGKALHKSFIAIKGTQTSCKLSIF